jgi:DNA-binding transcriptional regulator LsrR (DeoR family)
MDKEVIKKIESFFYNEPRSIQEIAVHIGKNWRTADRYVQKIKDDYGTLDIKIFREGTRGSLKIVYWSSVENISHSSFQEQLEQDIFTGKMKEDFSSFNIYQYVNDGKKKVFVYSKEIDGLDNYVSLLTNAKKQILFFSLK